MNTRTFAKYFVILTMLGLLAACGGGGTPGSSATAITAQPTDRSVVAGTTATFDVVASNASGYQWQSSTDGGANFIAVAGATSTGYTTPVTTLADSGMQYRVVVTGASNSVTSSAVTLTVTPVIVAPAISVQPAGQTITAGQDASFPVTASGTTLSYQWQRSTDGGANFTDIAGATNATLTLTAVPLADNAHQFRVVVSNSAGSVTSNAALLTVTAAQTAPAFSTQPANQGVIAPNTATFSVAVTGNPGPMLQWQVSTNAGSSFADIAGATASSYTTAATVAGDNGNQYRAVATNASGSTTSNVATLTVDLPAAPSFTTQPVNIAVTEGQNAQFTVVVSGTPTPTLQWQVSTDSGANWSNITNETGSTYTAVAPAQANNGRQFRCVASNTAGSVNSNAAVLTVNPASPLANIVFERQYGIQSAPSDLFLIKEDGSGEIALAASTDHETFLAIAPGGRVVYRRITGGLTNFYSVNADGTGTMLLVSAVSSTDFPIFNGITPSGWVIYRRDTATAGRDIYAVKADGTGTATIANTSGHEDFATITASGRIIYKATVAGGIDLYSINADGTGKATLAASLIIGGSEGVTSTGQVVFSSCNSFSVCSHYSIHENGGTATHLATDTFAGEYSMYLGGITTTGQVIFRKSSSPTWVEGYQTDLYGNGTVALAASADSEIYSGSTASGQVIYRRSTASGNDLYIVNADGSGTQLLTEPTTDDSFLSLTPDGRILYGRLSNSGTQYDIYMVNADGSNNVPVANSTDYEAYKAVTADGHVIYERTVGSTTYLYAYNTANSITTALANSGGHAFFVAITSNNKVLFRRQAGQADLHIINTDGTGSTPLADTGNNEFFYAAFE